MNAKSEDAPAETEPVALWHRGYLNGLAHVLTLHSSPENLGEIPPGAPDARPAMNDADQERLLNA